MEDSDKMSIILGIIAHFKGEKHDVKVKEQIQNKAPIEILEKSITMEELVLTYLVETCEKYKKPIIDIESDDIHLYLCQKLGFIDDKDKGAPSNQKPRKILDNLGLIPEKSNCGFNQYSRRVFHILTTDLKVVLMREGYQELEKRLGILILSPIEPLKLLSENTKEIKELWETKDTSVKAHIY